MYIYMVEPSFWDFFKERVAGISYWSLIDSIQIRWFSRRSGGRGWSFLLEAKSLGTNSKKTGRLESTQISWFSWQSGKWLVCVNRGRLKGYILWGRSNERWKTTLDSQANLSNRPKAAYEKESTYSLSLVRFLWRRSWSRWRNDDEWEPIELTTSPSPCDSDSGYWLDSPQNAG